MANKSDDIDIKDFAKIVYNFYLKHKVYFQFSFILAILTGILVFFETPVYYETDMYIGSNIYRVINSEFYEDLEPLNVVLVKLEKNVNLKNYAYVKNELKYTNYKNLKFFKIEKDEHNICITIQVYDKSDLDTLQKLILDYCNNNVYIKSLIEKQNLFYNSIDSILKDREFQTVKELNSEKDFICYDYSGILDLDIKKSHIFYLLRSPDAVKVISPFSKYADVNDPKLVNGILGFLVFELASLIFIFIFDIIKSVKND